MSGLVLPEEIVSPFPRLADGDAGGKGKGLERLDALLRRERLDSSFPGLKVALPRTCLIGTDAFDAFLAQGGLPESVRGDMAWDRVRGSFCAAPVPGELRNRLAELISREGRPLIVRSSSRHEDTGSAPFSGVYSSYIIPNSHESPERRLSQLEDAVRLVWAGVFSPRARKYCAETGMPRDQEKMAVIVQELVGARRGRWFYPYLSGVAQSYNYYPLSHAKAQDGMCGVALGLGAWVVNGGAAFRFCPKYPTINTAPPERASEGAQRRFLALDMGRTEPQLLLGEDAALDELELDEAEGTDALGWLASTWDPNDRRLVPGTGVKGPRVLDFAPILKYDALPLAPALGQILDACAASEGRPVEMEFAVDRDPRSREHTLYLLQVKAQIANSQDETLDLDSVVRKDCLAVSDRVLGHGNRGEVRDVLWIDPAKFDRSRTRDMAMEISTLNSVLAKERRPYLLAGPGRWGTRDPWLGVPVAFSDISGTRAVVETEIPGFAADFSFGSHFLHNLMSLKRGYFSLGSGGPNHFDWEWLRSLRPASSLRFATWTSLEGALEINVDGLRGHGVVKKPGAGGS